MPLPRCAALPMLLAACKAPGVEAPAPALVETLPAAGLARLSAAEATSVNHATALADYAARCLAGLFDRPVVVSAITLDPTPVNPGGETFRGFRLSTDASGQPGTVLYEGGALFTATAITLRDFAVHELPQRGRARAVLVAGKLPGTLGPARPCPG